MKKIALSIIVIGGVSFASCKKDRTCTCSYTESGSTIKETIIFHKVSNKTAESDCVNQTMIGDDGTGPSAIILTCKLD